MFHKATVLRHANNLVRILQPPADDKMPRPQRNLALIADNGPDWNVEKSLIDFLYIGRVWRELGLDRILLVHYAANYSKYNPIERRWGWYILNECILCVRFYYVYGRLLLSGFSDYQLSPVS